MPKESQKRVLTIHTTELLSEHHGNMMTTEHFLREFKGGFLPSTRQCSVLRRGGTIKSMNPNVPDLQRTRPKASRRNALSLGKDPWGIKILYYVGGLSPYGKGNFFFLILQPDKDSGPASVAHA